MYIPGPPASAAERPLLARNPTDRASKRRPAAITEIAPSAVGTLPPFSTGRLGRTPPDSPFAGPADRRQAGGARRGKGGVRTRLPLSDRFPTLSSQVCIYG